MYLSRGNLTQLSLAFSHMKCRLNTPQKRIAFQICQFLSARIQAFVTVQIHIVPERAGGAEQDYR